MVSLLGMGSDGLELMVKAKALLDEWVDRGKILSTVVQSIRTLYPLLSANLYGRSG
jgi:hypothetical protein